MQKAPQAEEIRKAIDETAARLNTEKTIIATALDNAKQKKAEAETARDEATRAGNPAAYAAALADFDRLEQVCYMYGARLDRLNNREAVPEAEREKVVADILACCNAERLEYMKQAAPLLDQLRAITDEYGEKVNDLDFLLWNWQYIAGRDSCEYLFCETRPNGYIKYPDRHLSSFVTLQGMTHPASGKLYNILKKTFERIDTGANAQ